MSKAKPKDTNSEPKVTVLAPHQKLVGKIVLYNISENEIRPALVVRAWSETCVNLMLFLDGENDGAAYQWKTSACKGQGVNQWIPQDEAIFEEPPTSGEGEGEGEEKCTVCEPCKHD